MGFKKYLDYKNVVVTNDNDIYDYKHLSIYKGFMLVYAQTRSSTLLGRTINSVDTSVLECGHGVEIFKKYEITIYLNTGQFQNNIHLQFTDKSKYQECYEGIIRYVIREETLRKDSVEDPFYEPMKNTYIQRYEVITGVKPSWTATDGKYLKSIIKKIQTVDADITKDKACLFFDMYVQEAYNLKKHTHWGWIGTYFNLKNLSSKFNEIIKAIKDYGQNNDFRQEASKFA